MNTNAKLEDIKARSAEVAGAHTAYLAALLAERDANTALLDEVVSVIKPALPALVSRVITGCVMSGAGTTTSDAGWRGVPLLTDTGEAFGKPRTDGAKDATRGRFSGRTLYLSMDGTFIELDFTGSWSLVGGEVSQWTATARPLQAFAVTDQWDVDAVLDRIAAVLRQQKLGAKDERTDAIAARAQRLQALVKLARSL